MTKVAPSEGKKQQIQALLSGEGEQAGGQLLNELIRLSVEALVQDVVEREQAAVLGRERYERRAGGDPKLHRNGYEPGKLTTAEGVLEVKLPQVRGGGGAVPLAAVGAAEQGRAQYRATPAGARDVRRGHVDPRH